MPKQITILDPNGVEVAQEREYVGPPRVPRLRSQELWEDAVMSACEDLCDLLKRENPQLGTYTVTVREAE